MNLHSHSILYTLPACFLLLAGAIWSWRKRKLTPAGVITGVITGAIIFIGTGYFGLITMTSFFVVGSGATKWQANKKTDVSNEHENKTGRTAAQVLANSGCAALLGILALIWPTHLDLILLMMAGAFASATADTLSSELGMVYGRRFYNILTFKKDQRGLDGVISLEGTLIGLMGTFSIATIYALFLGWNILVLWVVIAGFTGNIVDSVLGATLERKRLVGNNVVNFLNTAAGAGVCWVLWLFN